VNKVFKDSDIANWTHNLKTFYTYTASFMAQNLLSSNDLKKSIGHSIDDILIGCKFNYQSCSSADFLWEYDKIYGNCYSFNSGFNSTGHRVELKKSSLAGYSYGLQLDLYVNFYENLTLFNSVTGGLGAILRIDNVTHGIDHVAEGVMVSAGSVTNSALGRENKFIMKQPYSDCVLDNDATTSFDSDIYKAILESNFSYSQQFCLTQCLQKMVIK
jgi:hypothetical protein